jgi:hypothetical protein
MVWVSGRDNDKPSIAFWEIVFKVNARIIGIIDEQKPSFWPVRKQCIAAFWLGSTLPNLAMST